MQPASVHGMSWGLLGWAAGIPGFVGSGRDAILSGHMTPIRLQNIVKRFGKTTAVDNISMSIEAGSLTFLLGPSGCGKTTLLRMLAGFTDPSSGSLYFGDKDVTLLPANKRNAGMVFQGYALWPHMSVRDNVAFGLQVRKVSKADQIKRVDEALRTVQMLKFADRKPNQLSGGQQQRVALARALVIEPTVLLLDEPLSNLDAKLRTDMRLQIKRICNNADITAVYVTHDQKEALSMADHIVVLRDGKIVQAGPPRTIYTRPTVRFVADFLGETNFITAEIIGREGENVYLECAAGKFVSTVHADNMPTTGNVTCAIRPESLRVTPGPAPDRDAKNVFSGRVVDEVYLGEMAQHHLVIGPEDMPIKAFEVNPRPLPSTDSPIHVSFDPGDVVILQD